MPLALYAIPETALKALRSFLQSNKVDQESINPSLIATRDSVFAKEEDWTAEKIKDAFAEFSAAIKPVRRNADGAPFDPIGPDSEFVQYLIRFTGGDQATLKNVLHTQFDLLCQVSVVSDAAKNNFFQSHYPATGRALDCLGGTGSRAHDLLMQVVSSVNEYDRFIASAHDSSYSKWVGVVTKFVNEGNESHIRRSFDYLLSLQKQGELVKVDSNWSTVKLPTAHAAAIYQGFEEGFVKLLYSSTEPEELKATIAKEVVSIKEEVGEALEESVKDITGINEQDRGLLVSGSTESCIELMVRLFEEKKLNDVLSYAIQGRTRVFEPLHDYEKKLVI